MVQVDLPAAFAVGQIYALLSRKYLEKDGRLFSHRLLGPLNLFLSCVYAPVGMFLLIGWPAWEVMYVSAWPEKPFDRPLVAGFYVLFAIVMVLLGNVGFVLAHHWLRKGRVLWVKIGAGVGLGLTVLPFLLEWGVWSRVGTVAEVVEEGGGYSMWAAPFFSGWIVVISYLVVGTVVFGLLFRRWGERFEP